ncbi:hypothetical protein RchiOBHm_Chr5g0008331 [Rosa chinensis]|uniref:Uncharacterized protein n=1 Tax=Rosa chinensis TaxID=74649 RepID=A0A2P6Q418_ROSCH|nr:hypothetical protein RchiOBHm_Chr5g0008331 [Rosa chinensis]
MSNVVWYSILLSVGIMDDFALQLFMIHQTLMLPLLMVLMNVSGLRTDFLVLTLPLTGADPVNISFLDCSVPYKPKIRRGGNSWY